MVQQFEDIVLAVKNDGIAILLVEQNLYSALVSTDRVYVLDVGQVVYN